MIAYVVSLFPCWSETFIVREILALRARGIPIKIFSLRPPCEPLVHDEARRLLKEVIYPLPRWRAALGAAGGFFRHPARWLRVFAEALREARPGGFRGIVKAVYTILVATYFAEISSRLRIVHVHAHWATHPALAARAMRALTGTGYTVTAHAHDIFLKNPYLHGNLASASAIITISEYNRRRLLAAGIEPAKIKIVPCGVDLEQFTGDGRPGLAGNVLFSAGRLEPIKGFRHLIDACANLKQRGVQFTCSIAGDGSLRAALHGQIMGKGLQNRVRLLGALSQEELQQQLAASDVFVLPCVQTSGGDQDGIPVALMEAMALGLPVITTPVSGIPELVTDGISGLLVPPANALFLADAIARLLKDPDLRQILGANGREVVKRRHDIAQSAAMLHEIFAEAIDAR